MRTRLSLFMENQFPFMRMKIVINPTQLFTDKNRHNSDPSVHY